MSKTAVYLCALIESLAKKKKKNGLTFKHAKKYK